MDVYIKNNKRCRLVENGAIIILQMIDENNKDIFPTIKTDCGNGFSVENGLFAVDWYSLVKETGKGIEQFLIKPIL